ncbi:hypothetical protein AAG906_011520 [Vitis piasezkii]
MDRSWMQLQNRLCNEYVEGVRTFIQAAKQHLRVDNKTRCPYLIMVEQHLIRYGFSSSYNRWIHHGDEVEGVSHAQPDMCSDSNGCAINDNYVDDEINDAINDMHGPRNKEVNSNESIGHEIGRNGKNIDYLFSEAHRELYPVVLTISHLTCCSNYYLMLFDGANIPKSHYDAKKMLRDFGLGYDSIHACKYDCALFWKENEIYKNGKIPQKVLRHFPLKPRLQRLFMSRYTSADMRWHKEKRFHEDGVLRHPADSEVWKDFDNQYPWFAQDARNVRLGLATDGFNPFGTMSNNYSMWPVVLVPYNMPPWKCMKESFFMMSLLIPGPHAPGKDIDIYLRPLVDELKELWHDGVHTFDMSSGDYFRMHACLLWTIHDFPAYGNLSGWSTKGYKACPTCNEDTSSQGIRSKICYMGHRRFLPLNHSWRRSRQHDGKPEHRPPPKTLSGEDILQQLSHVYNSRPGKHINNKDKKRKRGLEELNWTRKSIFFELEYWSKLKMRHNIDVMHVEKNVCDNVVNTLLNIVGKTKDTEKARLDLADMKIRNELHLQLKGNKLLKPHACYTLTFEERKEFCKFLKSVKNVNISDGKILGLKSHDCHVLLQRLLPVGIRPYLNKDICTALVELSGFFQKLCAKTLYVADLERLEEGIVIILCKLERIFPPAFFDIMIHLAVHLPREAKLVGPVSYRWMYPFERNEDNREEQASGHLSIFSQQARPIGGRQLQLSKEELEKAHCEHLDELRRISASNLELEQEKYFPNHEELYSLACGPDARIHTYTGCIHDGENVNFMEKIQQDPHFTIINISSTWYENDPFVLATRAHQVFYLDDYKMAKIGKLCKRFNIDTCGIFWRWTDIEVDANFDETNKYDAYQENESCDIEWSFELDDQLERFDRINVNPEVINNNILCMGDRNDDGDDDFICDDIIEEDIIVDNDNIVEEWLSSESESD